MDHPLISLLLKARADDASDILMPTGNVPVLKIHGKLTPQTDFAPLTEKNIYEFLEIVLKADMAKLREAFQKEKDLDFAIEDPRYGRLRVNALLTTRGPSCVLRVIKEKVPDFATLHLPEAQFTEFATYPQGLVLFTGSMGSGKSTSMASVIEYINQHSAKHVITIEDPVEYVYTNGKSVIQQREVGVHTHSFGHALRAAVREAANVILLGELRDLETISLALKAAETGTLVFASLHTAGVSHAIERIVESFPHEKQAQIKIQLSQILKAVIWQMFVPTVDGGLIPATEILINTHGVANLIRKGYTHQIANVVETSQQDGMMTMKQSIMAHVKAGLVDRQVAIDALKSIKGISEFDEEDLSEDSVEVPENNGTIETTNS